MRTNWIGLAAGTAASLAFAGAAAADGMPGSVKDAPAPVVYNWSGLSVGVGIGAGKFDQDAYANALRKDDVDKKICQSKYGDYFYNCGSWYDYDYKVSFLEAFANQDDWNWFGTVQVAYDRLLTDRILVGVFADFDFYNDADLTLSDKYYGDFLKGLVERDNLWTVGGRLGLLVTPRVLFYGLIAYSQMSLDGSLTAHFDDPFYKGNPTDLALKVEDKSGSLTFGGGIEAMLHQRLSLKIEYRWSQFDGAKAKIEDERYDGWYQTYGCPYDCDYKVFKRKIEEKASLDIGDTDVHSIRAVLSLKLGDIHDRAPAPLK